MDLTGERVQHKAFGEGVVTKQTEDGYLFVRFGMEEKQFVYPNIFEGFLKTNSDALMEKINKEIAERKAEAAARKKEKQEAEERNRAKQAVTLKATRKIKPPQRENIAFKCNYCDGGLSKKQVGFEGICSDAAIRHNVLDKKRTWCSSEECDCNRYLQGELTRRELETSQRYGGVVCYESQMLKDWRAMAGVIQNGEKKGQPMKLNRVQANSLCVLTTCSPGMEESERYIFAVFLVDETYEGDDNEEGYVMATDRFRIKLSPQEAKKMQFWNYYKNPNNPQAVAWNSGLHRYLNDEQAARILWDIAQVKKSTSDAALAEEFLHHFINVHQINFDAAAGCQGALLL